jgi:hypothetical protein
MKKPPETCREIVATAQRYAWTLCLPHPPLVTMRAVWAARQAQTVMDTAAAQGNRAATLRAARAWYKALRAALPASEGRHGSP